MSRVNFALVIALVLSLTPAAQANPVCDLALSKVLAAVPGARFDRKVDTDPTRPGTRERMFLKTPDASELEIFCAPETWDRMVSLAWKNKFPSASFFDHVGRAGAVLTGRSTTAIRKGAVECYEKALKQPTDDVRVLRDDIVWECVANVVGYSVHVYDIMEIKDEATREIIRRRED